MVPLLSGHVGGANDLARRAARLTGGTAAISTATDVNGRFAVDSWAKCKGLYIDSKTAAKRVSAALLAGDSVGVQSDFTIRGEWPDGFSSEPSEVGIALTADAEKAPYPVTLRLVPPVLTLGIGCRRGTSADAIARAVEGTLRAFRLHPRAVFQVSTIDLKKEETGLLEFCRTRELSLRVWTAEELAETPGAFTPSSFVRSVTGVDNVCERAAVRAGGKLLVPKRAADGVTVAVARRPWAVSFEEGEETPCE